MLYRITTETKNNLRELTSAVFKGATINDQLSGLWEGVAEPATSIEIDSVGVNTTETAFRDRVYQLARTIRDTNKQQAVLVQEFAVKSRLVCK